MADNSSFHRRQLLLPSVALSSSEGKALFGTALVEGNLEGYFPLAENFVTQSHPAFCGLGSLTMVLNSLLIDPQRQWQGNWRWFDDFMLDCCEPLEVVKMKGITLSKLSCLARCNGARSILKYASNISLEEFRNDVESVSKSSSDTLKERNVMIASYSRKILNQTGSGHFSPIAGYCKSSDMVLILDVARFKYPPHWVPLPLLYQSMNAIDSETNKSRGYLLVSVNTDENGGIQLDCKCSNKVEDNATCNAVDNASSTDSTISNNGDQQEVVDLLESIPQVKQQCVNDLKSLMSHSCDLCG
mmetsp:Transcript_19329/g.27657  ORF Transcript_19329/g.27657 Transcript_19329/m.27657 type:complete len:301 (-) Transcript_19329:2146-3048(-)